MKIMETLGLRRLWFICADICLINLSAIFALAVRFEFDIPGQYITLLTRYSVVYTGVTIAVLYFFNCYKSLWRFASVKEMLMLVFAGLVSNGVVYGVFSLLKIELPRSFYIINVLSVTALVGGIRFSYRLFWQILQSYKLKEAKGAVKRVLIVGGGKAGETVISELFLTPRLAKVPVAIADDDVLKIGKKIHGVPILGGRKEIGRIVQSQNIDEIIIAIPSLDSYEKSQLVNICKETNCKLKILPGMFELIDGRVDIKRIKDVEIEDLLGREPVKLDIVGITGYLTDKVVLVTGGGGSIGSEICTQVAKLSPKKLIIFDIYENNVYEIQRELIRQYGDNLQLEIIIGSIRDKKRLVEIFELYRPEIVFHAAAHKHVPLMENNPAEAIKNNVFGTLNVAEISNVYGVKKFILISTDKAVNPTNVMGATKRIAEIIIQTMDKTSETEYAAVRFGNVLGSNGSVIPLFKKQIEEGGPVTVTHPDIIRYFMTIPEATGLVLQAGAMASGGEIFVLDMGEPVKISNLARDLIMLSGFEPDKEIEIQYTGLRPGEKLREELIMAEESLSSTNHKSIYRAKPIEINIEDLRQELWNLEMVLQEKTKDKDMGRQYDAIYQIMQKLVPTYRKTAV